MTTLLGDDKDSFLRQGGQLECLPSYLVMGLYFGACGKESPKKASMPMIAHYTGTGHPLPVMCQSPEQGSSGIPFWVLFRSLRRVLPAQRGEGEWPGHCKEKHISEISSAVGCSSVLMLKVPVSVSASSSVERRGEGCSSEGLLVRAGTGDLGVNGNWRDSLSSLLL